MDPDRIGKKKNNVLEYLAAAIKNSSELSKKEAVLIAEIGAQDF